MDVSFDSSVATNSKVCDATDFQCQAFRSLDKHDSHIGTTVEVRKCHHKVRGTD